MVPTGFKEDKRDWEQRMMKGFLKVFFLVALLAGFAGCGYVTRSNFVGDTRTIYVESFGNDITFTAEGERNLYFPLLEVKTRNAVIDRFLFDGNLKIAKTDLADLVLKGKLKSYNRAGLRFTDNDDVEEYRVQIFVELTLWDQKKKEVVWTEPGLVGEATYFVTGPAATSEESAVQAAIIDLARRTVERTVEDW